MTKKEYNGWTNYETWLVKLWIDNDENSLNHWNKQAEGYLKADGDSSIELADALKDYHKEALPELEGFAADLMNAALSEVDWLEIANWFIEDAKAEALRT